MMQEHLAPHYFKPSHSYAVNQSQFGVNSDDDDILDDLFLEGELPIEDTNNNANWNQGYDVKTTSSTSANHNPVQISLFHKQRGGKGTWKLIEHNELIRVTKGVGKKLKLVIKSATPLESSQVQINLLDVGQPEELSDKTYQMTSQTMDSNGEPLFVVESEQMKIGGSTQLEYEIKLFQLSKTLCFEIVVNKPETGPITLRSVLFGTHNSGKQKKKKDGSEDSPRNTQSALVTSAAPSSRARKMSIDTVQDDEHVVSAEHVIPGSIDVLGVMKARGFVQFSDLTLKTSFEDLSEALEQVLLLEGKSFEWKPEALGMDPMQHYSTGRAVCGLIAQQVAQVVPEASRRDERGVWSISPAPLIALIVEALKSHVIRVGSDSAHLKGNLARLKHVLSNLDHNLELLPNLRADLERLTRLVNSHVTGEDRNTPSWLQRLKLKMTIFGKRRVSNEARLGAQLVVVLVCRKDHVIQQKCKDFFMVLYKHDTLIADQFLPLGKHRQARVLPVRVDHVAGGDFQGTYTVVIGGIQATQCCAEGGIIAVYDFRKTEESAHNNNNNGAPNCVMRMQLCQPNPLHADTGVGSALWIVGRFKLTHTPSETTWISAQNTAQTQQQHVTAPQQQPNHVPHNNNTANNNNNYSAVPQYHNSAQYPQPYYAPHNSAQSMVYNFNGPTFVMPAQVPPPPSPLQPQSAGPTQQFLSHPLFVQRPLPHMQPNVIYTDVNDKREHTF